MLAEEEEEEERQGFLVRSVGLLGLFFLSSEVLGPEPRGSNLGRPSHARHKLCH